MKASKAILEKYSESKLLVMFMGEFNKFWVVKDFKSRDGRLILINLF